MAALTYSLSDYDYYLPLGQIAQQPVKNREQSRLLVFDAAHNTLQHRSFTDIIEYLAPGDMLVLNNTRVFPARLHGRKKTGGKVEVFLLEYPQTTSSSTDVWQEAEAPALLKSAKRGQEGYGIFFSDSFEVRVDQYLDDGKAKVTIRFCKRNYENLEDALAVHGQVPLPPYIKREHGSTAEDSTRYQTSYARHTGSVAAPTAGLHFSDKLLQRLSKKGINITYVTLHVGYGTFAPVRVNDIRNHTIHQEYVSISEQAAQQINNSKKKQKRIWAVGTTSVRTLEYATDDNGKVQETKGPCDLYIYPGYSFKTVDNLITNFHLPQSSLLFLVSALAGREQILEAYQQAVARGYRFFSYGDAMAVITKP